jgi:hypothetical protein
MALVTVEKWWKAKEIPLVEINWRNIRLYWQEDDDFWDWTDTVYFIRLSPPFSVLYGKESSPLVYTGSGAIQQRWQSHRDRLYALGESLPGGRYEIWVFRDLRYKEIEADSLLRFQKWTDHLPLMNQRVESSSVAHTYSKEFDKAADTDRRYWWSIYPTRPDILEIYETGLIEA